MDLPRNGHQQRQERRREEILTAASSLFFENGYGRTSMDDILKKIGGSKGTLYSHFKGKADLFAAIVRRVSDRTVANFQMELNGDLKENLRLLGNRYLEATLSPEALALYRMVVSESKYFPELANTLFENGPLLITRSLIGFFEKHNAEGKIHIADPEMAARQFIGMIRADTHSAAILSGRNRSSAELQVIVDKAIETLINGAVTDIKPKSSANS